MANGMDPKVDGYFDTLHEIITRGLNTNSYIQICSLASFGASSPRH